MDFKKKFILLTGFLLSSLCHGEIKDPTKPASYSAKSEVKKRRTDTLRLTSIWASGNSKRIAINGVSGKKGDLILANVRIVEIYNDSVVIRQNGKIRKLYLLNRSTNLSKTAFQ